MAGLVLEPLPTGAWAFLAVTVSIFTKTLSFTQAFTAFSNDVIWLIVVSFFFAAVNNFPPLQGHDFAS
jgi:DASS family divalent anion:Na+ symporter